MSSVLKRTLCFPAFDTIRYARIRLSSTANVLMKSTGVPSVPLVIAISGDGFQKIRPASKLKFSGEP